MLTFISRVNPVNEKGSQKCGALNKKIFVRKRKSQNGNEVYVLQKRINQMSEG